MASLREILDPELGLDVVALGLVYGVDVDGTDLRVRLTMTTPACPLGEQIVRDAEHRLRSIAGVGAVRVDLVWEPPWHPSMMSPAAKDQLGWNRR